MNELLNRGCVIRTNESFFYHGKVYIFLTADYTITITGSTNLSRNAFGNNKELDSLFIYPRHEINPFLKWFNDFRSSADEIEYLDVSKFNESA
ncbi:phospholipase D-like domain-containing protein [Anaerocolumna sp.]|uniref:phospholipase D-like domain-containing protein n=1 Tax=Anaerocolumna sp. TaxID=2041569 RepID=UPI003FA473A6